MYYVIGEWSGIDFILDTKDSSCEIISFMDLIKSGIDFKRKKDNNISLNKFMAVNNLSQFKNILSFPICRCLYRFGNKTSESSLRIVLLKASEVFDESRGRLERCYAEYGYFTDVFVFVDVINTGIFNIMWSGFDRIIFQTNFGVKTLENALLIPPLMLGYLFSICNERNYDKLHSALSDFFV